MKKAVIIGMMNNQIVATLETNLKEGEKVYYGCEKRKCECVRECECICEDWCECECECGCVGKNSGHYLFYKDPGRISYAKKYLEDIKAINEAGTAIEINPGEFFIKF